MKNQSDADQSEKQRKYTAPALEKGLEILELLAITPEGLNLTEISKRLNRSKTEIYRMVAVLNDHHYIDLREIDQVYQLSLKLFHLSHRHAPIQKLSSVAIPIMKDLCNQTSHSSHIVVYSDGGGLIINYQDPDNNENRLTLPVGGRGPLFNNCAGHVLLAFASYDSRERMIKAYSAKISPQTINSKKVRDAINRVYNQGYEEMASPVLKGVFDIGFPIFDRHENAVAVLMMSILLHRSQPLNPRIEILKRKLEGAAAKISERIGYHPESD